MGEETYKNIRSWEEEIYWRHFKCIHFSQFMHAGFDRRMAIPVKFTRKLSRKLPEVVSLKGPSGATWKVGLTINGSLMFFSDGWEVFVKDHLLEENDFLVFKYNGDSQFDVLIFDGQSMCEKAASYFVKRTIDENLDDVTVVSDNDVVGSQQKRNAYIDDDNIPARKPKEGRVTKRWRFNSFRPSQSARSVEPLSDSEELDVKPDVGRMFHNNKPMRGALLKRAQQLARAAVSDEGLVVVMLPSHLKDRYFVNLPVVWMKKHFSLENQEVILRFEGKAWHIRFLVRTVRDTAHRGAFSCGWRKFAVDNNLHLSDVCVFEPGTKLNGMVVLDVQIFRARQ